MLEKIIHLRTYNLALSPRKLNLNNRRGPQRPLEFPDRAFIIYYEKLRKGEKSF